MAVTMKNVFWAVAPCGFIIKDVSEERVASIFRVEEITPKMWRHAPPKRQFIINSHGTTFQKTVFFRVTYS
jgi:hypothetical protein